jgi:hypothetical protein
MLIHSVRRPLADIFDQSQIGMKSGGGRLDWRIEPEAEQGAPPHPPLRLPLHSLLYSLLHCFLPQFDFGQAPHLTWASPGDIVSANGAGQPYRPVPAPVRGVTMKPTVELEQA